MAKYDSSKLSTYSSDEEDEKCFLNFTTDASVSGKNSILRFNGERWVQKYLMVLTTS